MFKQRFQTSFSLCCSLCVYVLCSTQRVRDKRRLLVRKHKVSRTNSVRFHCSSIMISILKYVCKTRITFATQSMHVLCLTQRAQRQVTHSETLIYIQCSSKSSKARPYKNLVQFAALPLLNVLCQTQSRAESRGQTKKSQSESWNK